MAWFRPEYETEYNTPNKIRDPLSDTTFNSFMDQFIDNRKDPVFSEDERETMKPLILAPLKFSTGYPLNVSEPPIVGSVYIIESGWQQKEGYIGSSRLDGMSQTDITVIGSTSGNSLNMAEPSLILKLITSLLIAGRNYFTAFHLEEPTINENPYQNDEQRSVMFKVAMRTVTMSYKSDRFTPITKYGVSEDG